MSQSIMKLALVSVQFRVTLTMVCAWGLALRVGPTCSPATYLPHVPLMAVLPSPNTSQAAAKRGLTSRQFGTSSTAAYVRAGTNGPAGTDWAGTLPIRYSQRTPGLTVTRFRVQSSPANTPPSAFISSRYKNGVATSVI